MGTTTGQPLHASYLKMVLYQKYRNGFIADSDDKDISLAQHRSDASSEIEEGAVDIFRIRKKRAGKKSPWLVETTDELINIICSDKYTSEKLYLLLVKLAKKVKTAKR